MPSPHLLLHTEYTPKLHSAGEGQKELLIPAQEFPRGFAKAVVFELDLKKLSKEWIGSVTSLKFHKFFKYSFLYSDSDFF